MKLTLDRGDLKPQFNEVNCSQTKFEHFKPYAQEAIVKAGKATFWEYDHMNYNVIYPPEN